MSEREIRDYLRDKWPDAWADVVATFGMEIYGEAYRKSAEDMRRRAAGTVYHVTSLVPCVTLDRFAAAINALPIEDGE